MDLWCYSLESTNMPGKIFFQADSPFSELPVSTREDGKLGCQAAEVLKGGVCQQKRIAESEAQKELQFPQSSYSKFLIHTMKKVIS